MQAPNPGFPARRGRDGVLSASDNGGESIEADMYAATGRHRRETVVIDASLQRELIASFRRVEPRVRT
jgi:hypothetical protein